MNSHQRMIYSSQLQHAERRNHKYLYKIGDRYIYPEDVAGKAKSTASNIGSMATAAGTAAKTKISNTIADQKIKLKDKKYLLDEKRRKYPNLEKANVTSPGGKRVNQITSAHQEGTKKTTALSYQSTHDPISNKVVKVRRDFDKYGNQIGVGYSTEPSHISKKKAEKRTKAGIEAGRNRATARATQERTEAGVEAGRARARSIDGDKNNWFRKNRAIDSDKEVRKARKKWLGYEDNDYTDEGGMKISKNSSAGKANEKANLKYSVSKTPHEGAKAKAKKEYRQAIDKAGEDRDAYLKARRTAVGIEAGRDRRRKKK